MNRMIALEAHVRTGMYPPLPIEYAKYADQAIELCNQGQFAELVVIDKTLNVYPHKAEWDEEYDAWVVTALDLLSALHLEHWIQDEYWEDWL